MSATIEQRVEALLQQVEAPVPLKDRCAWAISHQPELVACIRDLLRFINGQQTASSMLASKASRLLVASSRLLSNPRGRRDFIEDWVEGTSPDFRSAHDALKSELEQK